MPKVLIVYISRTGETQKIAELIGEGVRIAGAEARVISTSDVKSEKNLLGYEAYVFGSPTYHGQMLEPMKQMLFLAEKAGLKGKVGGSFGAFGWSGEAVERIYDTMKNVFQMDMVADALRLKSAGLGGGIKMAQDYGRDIAAKLGV